MRVPYKSIAHIYLSHYSAFYTLSALDPHSSVCTSASLRPSAFSPICEWVCLLFFFLFFFCLSLSTSFSRANWRLPCVLPYKHDALYKSWRFRRASLMSRRRWQGYIHWNNYRCIDKLFSWCISSTCDTCVVARHDQLTYEQSENGRWWFYAYLYDLMLDFTLTNN